MGSRSAARSGSWLVVAAVAAACSSSSAPATPAAPVELTVQQSVMSFDDVVLRWTPPAGPLTGYEAEGRIEDGPWESLGPIDADVVGGTLTLDASVPELTHLTFRIRSLNRGKASGWVEAAFLRGLRWPQSTSSEHGRGGIVLAWTNASTAATGIRVSRLFEDGWRVLAELAPTAQGFTDGQLLFANQGVSYRITATSGVVESLPADLYDAGYPPVAVFDLTATVEAAGVRLRWANPPLVADAIEIHRVEGLVAAIFANLDPVVLPSTAVEYLDPLAGGTWTWHVVTRYPGNAGAPFAQVRGISDPPPTPLPLSGAILLLPDASAMASDGQGTLAFAIGGSFSPPATGGSRLVFQGAGAPSDADLGTGHGFAEPQVAFDPAGHPHAVVLRPVPGNGLVSVVHTWHDGAAWHEEEVAQRPLDDPTTVRFALDVDGALHLAWSTRTGSVRVEYARRLGAGWNVEDLTAAVPNDARVVAFDVDGLGSPAVALNSSSTGALLARREGGWTAETVPLPPPAGWVTDVRRSPGGIAVAGTQCVGPVGATTAQLVLVERGAAGFGPAQIARDLGPCQPVDWLRVLPVAGGDRTMLWGAPVGRLELDLRTAGAWAHVDTRPAVAPTGAAWVDGAGKVHLVVRSDGYVDAGGLAPYVSYVEP